MIALLFPGQGMEEPRMGVERSASSVAARALLDAACNATGLDVLRLLTRGGRDLARTEVLQPTLVAVALGALQALEEQGVRGDFVLGHSLGELCAWTCAGGPSATDAVALAAERGRLMAQAAARAPGGMAAVFGSRSDADAALAAGAAHGTLVLAAHNAPDEWVLSGDEAAIAAVVATGAARRLAVAGAWHSPLMEPAVAGFRAALAGHAAPVGHAACAHRAVYVSNRDGEVTAAAELADHLAGQLVRPLHFCRALQGLWARGVTHYVTVGPGRTLRALVRRTLGDTAELHATDDEAALARTVAALLEQRSSR